MYYLIYNLYIIMLLYIIKNYIESCYISLITFHSFNSYLNLNCLNSELNCLAQFN